WTQEGEKSITVEPGVDEVTLVNMVGAETVTPVENGKLPLTVGLDLTYLRGVSPDLEAQATTELNPDRWPREEGAKERGVRVVPRFAEAPELDGSFENWQDVFQMEMINAKVNGKDASGVVYLGWD